MRALMYSGTPAASAARRAAAMRAASSAGSRGPSSMLMPTAPAAITWATVSATASASRPKPSSTSAVTGTSTVSTTRRTSATARSRSRWPPSATPRPQATPALVVATAGAPVEATMRALAPSQALARVRGVPGTWRAWNRAALSC